MNSEMLRRFAKTAGEVVLGTVRRFLTNQPRNEYESIAFGAVRLIAFTFGKRGAVNVVRG